LVVVLVVALVEVGELVLLVLVVALVEVGVLLSMVELSEEVEVEELAMLGVTVGPVSLLLPPVGVRGGRGVWLDAINVLPASS
jgi:hypothetical protein